MEYIMKELIEKVHYSYILRHGEHVSHGQLEHLRAHIGYAENEFLVQHVVGIVVDDSGRLLAAGPKQCTIGSATIKRKVEQQLLDAVVIQFFEGLSSPSNAVRDVSWAVVQQRVLQTLQSVILCVLRRFKVIQERCWVFQVLLHIISSLSEYLLYNK